MSENTVLSRRQKKIELFYNFYFLKNWRGIKPNFRTTKNLFLQISVFLIESE